MFRNVNLSNLENNLQRNLRTESTIFKAFGDTNFENIPTQHQPCIFWSAPQKSGCITAQ